MRVKVTNHNYDGVATSTAEFNLTDEQYQLFVKYLRHINPRSGYYGLEVIEEVPPLEFFLEELKKQDEKYKREHQKELERQEKARAKYAAAKAEKERKQYEKLAKKFSGSQVDG